MPRIQPVEQKTADPAIEAPLGSVRKSMGTVPNLIATMANSPAVAKAYLGFAQALSAGALPRRLREQIALVVGEANACGYYVAAHTVLGRRAGLTEQETKEARRAASRDGKEQAALVFARKVVRDHGVVADDDVEQLRRAGYTDGEIGEIVANVALNIFTNYFNCRRSRPATRETILRLRNPGEHRQTRRGAVHASPRPGPGRTRPS